jgi:BirA family transcriptional regulator, biotin operon repressor / biotin---[acetyl-CoA-carboxylase] ligase
MHPLSSNISKLPELIYFESLDSTNDYATALIANHRPIEETAIVAGYQTQGKGQIGSTWESEAGKNLLCSIIYYPKFLSAGHVFDFQAVILNGLFDFIQHQLPGIQLAVKWPNDLYAENRKICGMLMQSAIRGNTLEYLICGIGLNVSQTFDQNLPSAVSMASFSSEALQPMDILPELRLALHSAYSDFKLHYSDDFALSQLELLNSRMWKYGQKHTFFLPDQKQLEAHVRGVSREGLLLLQDEMGHIHAYLPKTLRWKTQS